ncbi:hypothetical protein [Enterococcus bulliens]
MTVQFVLGDGVCDHTETLVQKADEWLQQDANHRVFFWSLTTINLNEKSKFYKP